MTDDSETVVHRHGFIKVRGTRYESVSGPRIRIERQKRMHKFGSGYQDTGPAVPLFAGSEEDARRAYEALKELFDDE